MLAEEGMEGKFGNILNTQDFFPESFFYQFIGYPENIFLYNDIFEEAYSNSILWFYVDKIIDVLIDSRLSASTDIINHN